MTPGMAIHPTSIQPAGRECLTIHCSPQEQVSQTMLKDYTPAPLMYKYQPGPVADQHHYQIQGLGGAKYTKSPTSPHSAPTPSHHAGESYVERKKKKQYISYKNILCIRTSTSIPPHSNHSNQPNHCLNQNQYILNR